MLIQPWIKVMYCLLLWLTLHQSGDPYLPSIHSWDSSPSQVLYIPLFFLTVPRVVPVFFKFVISLTSFLFKSKITSFPICDSAHIYSAHQVIIITVIIIILLLLIININIYIIYIYIYIYIYICYQGGLGVSTHSKFSSAGEHLYYCLSDKYVIKVA